MNPAIFIKQRQIFWALRHDIQLGGQFRHDPDPGEAVRGEASFVYELADNLFEPLLPECRREYEAGDGGELRPNQNDGRMYAVNSSSALVVNVFHYWRRLGQVADIAQSCQLHSTAISGLEFEAHYPIDDQFERAPNLDVVIHYARKRGLQASAIESKFQEPYADGGHRGLSPDYLNLARLWADIAALREVAEVVSPENNRFAHLDAPQLIKHILGLKEAYSKGGFRLLYLWYAAPGHEAVRHAQEIEEFSSYTERDGIKFQTLSYQEVFLSLARNKRGGHTAYIDYLMERYF
ncbi:MAG: PGN_0703 family putative restriction endonuclease [Isosphaeraceae bacterium]